MRAQLLRRSVPSSLFWLVLLGLLAVGTALAEGTLQSAIFLLFGSGCVLASAILWPELLITAYMFAGRFSFEPRLAPFDVPLSLNQMMLVGLVGVGLAHWREIARSYRSWTVVTLVLFALAIFLGLGWTRGLNYGIYKVTRTCGVVLPGVLIAMAVLQRRQSLTPLILATFLVGFGLNTLALLTFEQSMGINRLSSLGSGPITFARAVGAALMIATLSLFWFFQRRHLRGQLWLAVASLLAAAWLLPGFVLAQSRGPALALFVSVSVVLVLSMRRSWTVTLGGVVVSGGILWAAVWILRTTLEGSRFDLTKESNQAGLDGRVGHLRDTWDLILQNPLLGVGTGGWPVGVHGIDERDYPHNFFAEVASENGVPIALTILALFGVVVLRGLRGWWYTRDPRARYLILGALAAFAFFVVNILATGDSVDNRLIWLALGALEFSSRPQVWAADLRRSFGGLVPSRVVSHVGRSAWVGEPESPVVK